MTHPLKIAVLGNSHLAAAKTGWEQIKARYPGHALTFFGAPRDFMKDLELEGELLRPRTNKLRNKLRRSSDGLESVALGSYDGFILYGLEFGKRRMVQLYRTHRPASFEWREPLPELAPMEKRPDQVNMIPERLFDQAVLSGLTGTMCLRLAGEIRQVGGQPVQIVAAPAFNETVLESGDWDGLIGSGDTARLAKRFARLAKAACPEGMGLIVPRGHNLVHGFFTSRRFAVDTPADNGGTDHVHTNGDYGAEMLRHALSAFKDAKGMRAA